MRANSRDIASTHRRRAARVAAAGLVAHLSVACLSDVYPASDDAALSDGPTENIDAGWDATPGDAAPDGAPADAAEASRVLGITTGSEHACALMDNGDLRCWGEGSFGRLGYAGANGYAATDDPNDVGDDETPASVAPVVVGATPTLVEAGDHHTCVRTGPSSFRCWGEALGGRLGYGDDNNLGDNETPAAVDDITLDTQIDQIVAGDDHTCALLAGGTVRCWGYNAAGQLGYGHTNSVVVAVLAPDLELGGTAIELAAGAYHTCALLTGGAVRCWGLGAGGQLGYGNADTIGDDDGETPATVGPVSLGGNASHISAGLEHTCAVLTNGDLRCWGNADNGRLGYGNTDPVGLTDVPSAVDPVPVGTAVADVSAGGYHTCVRTTANNVRCWGIGGALGYGEGSTIGWSSDALPSDAGDVNVGATVEDVRTGIDFTCALLTTGAVRCWGLNNLGQLGYGDQVNRGSEPTSVPTLVGDAPIF